MKLSFDRLIELIAGELSRPIMGWAGHQSSGRRGLEHIQQIVLLIEEARHRSILDADLRRRILRTMTAVERTLTTFIDRARLLDKGTTIVRDMWAQNSMLKDKPVVSSLDKPEEGQRAREVCTQAYAKFGAELELLGAEVASTETRKRKPGPKKSDRDAIRKEYHRQYEACPMAKKKDLYKLTAIKLGMGKSGHSVELVIQADKRPATLTPTGEAMDMGLTPRRRR